MRIEFEWRAVAAGCLVVTSGCVSCSAGKSHMIATVQERAPAELAQSQAFQRAVEAMKSVDRADFVPRELRKMAYRERPESIGYEQTISSPYIVAAMTAAADPQPRARVLEIGTGSGYQAAILSRMAKSVYTIEIVQPLAVAAAKRLRRLGYANVTVRDGDGFKGWPEEAPFDAILVTAGTAEPPQPLLDQLAIGGRLIMPVGPNWATERILRYIKLPDGTLDKCVLGSATFVPLTGEGRRKDDMRILPERTADYCYGQDAGAWYFKPANAKAKQKDNGQ
ncbi:protein-L-isoaspartate(D-aspartate) O-methyltransferase [Tsuneonella sp. YG55]|uniref:Protein-L-isoaspartate O-methyltransferase n=1 Tax=Tsuneonella litorea TaxID=2976475 RepID=A0A9X2W3B5_9SPHN|nr:protein-L-isoaspartate(D-aspartate) O-methyltransferase [Tsuneonella litorea]MCT2560198.1 protein-L-isoaspartate(D-aspartate) O-methyltransferase [Tsuneonella litorea]